MDSSIHRKSYISSFGSFETQGTTSNCVSSSFCLSLHANRAYSPHLNPIEDAFTQVKQYIERHYLRAKAFPFDVIQEALESVSEEDAHNFFAHAGYFGREDVNMHE